MRLLVTAHLRHLWRDRWQTALAVLGVATGVAVVLAVDLANASSRAAMEVAQRQLDGVATHAISGAGERLDETLYRDLRLRWRAGDPMFADVTAMAPVVTGEVRLRRAGDEGDGWPVQLLGLDPTADTSVRGFVTGPAGAGARLMSEAGTVLLDAASARRLGWTEAADGLQVRAAGRWQAVRVIDTFDLQDRVLGQGLVVADIATAQELLDRVGWLSRIDLVRTESARAGHWGRILERVFPGLVVRLPGGGEVDLGGGLRMESLAARAADTRALAAAFQLNLAALGLLALVVGLFLVHGTLSHGVLRRQRQFGRLRALGVRPGELGTVVVVEALVIGSLGVLLGLPVGRWLASGLLALTAGTLENLYGQVAVAALAPDPVPALKAATVGLLATGMAALPAAGRAAAAAPDVLLRSQLVPAVHARQRLPSILLCIGIGAAALLPAFGYFGGLFAVAGVLMAAALSTPPVVARLLTMALRLAQRSTLGMRMLLRDAVRGLSRSGVASAALVVAMATALGMGLMVESFRESVDRWLEARLAAPLQLQLAGEHGRVPAALADVLESRAAGHLVRVTWPERIDGHPLHVSRIAIRGSVPEDLGLAMLAGSHDGRGLLVSEPLARRMGVGVGDRLAVPVPGAVRTLSIGGVFREYGAGPGLILVPESMDLPEFPGRLTVEVHAPRADLDGLTVALAAAAPEGTRVRDNDELLALARGVFERTFRVTGVLEAIAGVVAAFGLFAALTALGLDRRAQYGVLRTLGAGRALPAWQNLGEALMLALVAVALAMPLGALVAVILIEVVNVRAFGWSLDWHFSPWIFARALGVALAAGALAALAPALALWRASPAALLAHARAGTAVLAVLAVALVVFSPQVTAQDVRPGLDVGTLLGGDGDDGAFARADGPRTFRFPEDHGPHPDYRSEWWYLVAHLKDQQGRPFGAQFTLFRQALAPPGETDDGASDWRARQVWMAHVALTDADGRHLASERFARDALDLAGVRDAPFVAWLEDWRLASVAADGALFPLRLEVRVEDTPRPFELELEISEPRGPILQGQDGWSRKSERKGNASYYYSYTRMTARGRIHVDGRDHSVTGLGWMDREWSTSTLDAGQVGWDWFALHLADGRDLMLFQIRRDDGTIDGASAGMLVAADGSGTPLVRSDFELEPVDCWKDETGACWPVAWRVRVPSAGVDGHLRARHRDQLNRLTVRYWEGQVCVDGPVPGCGYLEMTGYRAPADGSADR